MEPNKRPINVLIPDGESHLLMEVVNCLSQDRGLRIFVMSNERRTPMRYSRFIHTYSYYPSTGTVGEWIANINRELEKYPIDVIMPIFEVGIGKMIVGKDLLKAPHKLLAWPSLENFEKAIDKWRLSQHLDKQGIACPKTFLVQSHSDPAATDFPLIVKPTKGFGGGMGVSLLRDKDRWHDFSKENNGSKTVFIAQEYIEGDDYCCNVLCLKGKILYHTVQKGILWGENRFSAQTGHEFIEQEDILSITSQVMRSLSWSGVACLDIRYDVKNDAFKIIEVNTRYWRSLMGSLASGLNFPVLSVYTHLQIEPGAQQYKKIEYLNLKGLIKSVKTNPGMIFKFRFLWNNTPLKFAILDPMPWVYKFFTRNWKLF